MSGWCVYLLRCGDGTLYCGITNDFAKRLAAHRAGKGARYTRGRGPLRAIYREGCKDLSAALKREHAIKQLPRASKLELRATKTPRARRGKTPKLTTLTPRHGARYDPALSLPEKKKASRTARKKEER